MHWLRAILSATWPTHDRQTPPLSCSDLPICIVGDLHGRLDLLNKMLSAIKDRSGHNAARVVWVGDMIDRGPDSAGVLARLHGLHRADPEHMICLMGNHERMLLDFLTDPARHGPRWIAAGGAETLTSFGLSPFTRKHDIDAWNRLAADLRGRLTAEVVDWLGALPLLWREGPLLVTHAGADPRLPVEAQEPRRLLWGARHRERAKRIDGLWVAQGHTVTPAPYARAGQICVDTGAWSSGTLSAAWVDAAGLSFFNVSDIN